MISAKIVEATNKILNDLVFAGAKDFLKLKTYPKHFKCLPCLEIEKRKWHHTFEATKRSIIWVTDPYL